MKFNILINQEKLIAIEPKARLVHGAILDYLHWLCNSPSQKIENFRILGPGGMKYTWIGYDWLLKEMPLLKGRTRATLTPIIRDLERFGFIKSLRVKSPDGGDRKYVALLIKSDTLFSNLNDPRLENYSDNNIKEIRNKKAGFKKPWGSGERKGAGELKPLKDMIKSRYPKK